MASTMSSFRACCQILTSIVSCSSVTLLLLLLHRALLSFLQPSSISLKYFLSYSKNHLICHLTANATIIFHWFPVLHQWLSISTVTSRRSRMRLKNKFLRCYSQAWYNQARVLSLPRCSWSTRKMVRGGSALTTGCSTP